MIKFLKNTFALTDQGVRGAFKSGVLSFLVFVINMVPSMLLLLLVDHLLLRHVHSTAIYLVCSIVTLVVMAVLLSFEYEAQYNETYKEAAHLRLNIAEKLSRLEMSYFAKHDLTDLSQSIMADVASLEHAESHAVPKLLAFCLFLPFLSVLMFIGNWKMAICAVGPTLLSFLLIVLSKRYVREQYNKHYLRLRENSQAFQDRIELSKEITAFNLAERIKTKLYAKLDDTLRVHWKSERNAGFLLIFADIFSHFSLAFTIIGGIFLMQTGEISVLYMLGYVLASMKLKEFVDSNMEFLMEVFYINSAVKRIREIRDAKVLDVQTEAATDVHTTDTQATDKRATQFANFDIEINKLSFSYDDTTPVLNDVSFTVPHGTVCALVGQSGCGKTTLLRLIARLYDFNSGSIRIGGVDIRKVSTENLYRNISIVFQDVTLFNTSILENIRIGREDATDEEVKHAAQLAHCDFIDTLPDGINTIIGENGQQLSGGERQRISIARAFLKNAPILILDEIASSLDVDNEIKIQQSLTELVKNKTVIIISHRMKSIENVDRIVVLKDGHVEACGTHAELIQISPTYQNLIDKTCAAEEFSY
ncbi:ABC transporter ATP-binding protein [Gardnerella vaginalis]|uniref:ABC transporter ATP-binding protein n=1 Tax=Gardnerella vaginalis TaxID=2702 RepID=UPI0007E3EC65|nr:ABC transporter ATP-binding protein [Gardnerella vaginalis]NSX29403.1 ABC transporter ATP-binding protein [Gardnerella vaginalis]PKZ47152.1 ABC transporter ATP-binding protein [Gardnerella vaginalis]PKZ58723.1 ABC transporter ATP-binding protein [Gardnerella vaginalis]